MALGASGNQGGHGSASSETIRAQRLRQFEEATSGGGHDVSKSNKSLSTSTNAVLESAPEQTIAANSPDSANDVSKAKQLRRELSKSASPSSTPGSDSSVKASTTKPASSGTAAASLEHLFCLDVFHVVLPKDAPLFPSHLPLKHLDASLTKAGGPKLFAAKYFVSVVAEACDSLGPLPGLRYLLECFDRLRDKRQNSREDLVAAASAAISDQVFLVVTRARINSNGRDDLLLALLQEPLQGLEHCLAPFIQMISHAARSKGPEMLNDMFWGSISGSHFHMRKLELVDAFEMPFSVMQVLMTDAAIGRLAVQHSDWTATSGRALEEKSLLGAFFHPSSTTNPSLVDSLWRGSSERDSSIMVHRRLGILRERQLALCRVLLRNSGTRAGLLQFFRDAAMLNQSKAKMHYDPSSVSSHGFLLNCSIVVTQLFLEELSAAASERDVPMEAVLNPLHWLKYSHLRWEEETPICSSDKVSAFRKELGHSAVAAEDAPRFGLVNDLFYLALNLFHVAETGASGQMKIWGREAHNMRQELSALEATREQWEGTTNQAPYRKRIGDLTDNIALVERWQRSLSLHLLNQNTCGSTLILFNQLFSLLLAAAGRDEEEETPAVFGAFPEFLLSDLVDYLPLVVRSGFKFTNITIRPVVEFLIRMMGHKTRISNGHLRGQLAQALSSLPVECLYGVPIAEEKLASACVSVWVVVEETGRHGQYFEKLETRQYVLDLHQQLRGVPWFDKSLVRMWSDDRYVFTRFVNLLLNDVEYVLDEAFKQLATIARLENLMEDRVVWGSQPAEQRQSQSEELQQAVRGAQGYCQFSTSLVGLLAHLVDVLPGALLCDELADRVACILDFFLRQLVGPRYNELNVRNPGRFRFQPRELLVQMMHIYVVLGRDERFVEALSKDERSFHAEEFFHGVDILNRNGLGAAQDRAAFRRLIQAVDLARKASLEEDEDPDDFPEEFACELMGTLMKDPVTLPSSGKVLDRAHIMRHLLTSEKDPFNRAPLTADMLVSNVELKRQIDEWRANRKK